MRYELDENGYVLNVFWGCHSGKCQEYTGTVPSGYSDLTEWSEKAIINAYYLVDGNLTLDSNRNYKLQLIQKQEAEENAHVTKKEMGMASTDEMNPYTDLFPSHQSSDGYIVSVDETFNKVGNLPTEEVNLSLYEKQDLDLIELEFIGRNFLPNTAISSVNNGIEYTQNKDKTIDIKGSATNRSTLNLAGTDTSVRNILTFKARENYLLSGLEGLNLEFYNYDGTDRTLIGTYNGGIISFEEDVNITQVVLVVDKGTTIDATIKPMIALVGLEHPVMQMKKYKGNLFKPTLIADDGQTIRISSGTVELNDDVYSLTATGTDLYFGEVTNTGEIYKGSKGNLIDVSEITEITYTLSNSLFKKNLITFYDSNKVSLGYEVHTQAKFTRKIPSDAKYVSFRFGINPATVGETYETTVLISSDPNMEYQKYNGRDGQYYVDGVSTQETRSGKNIFPFIKTQTINGVTLTKNNNGTLNLNGTATEDTSFSIYVPINESRIVNNEIYTLSKGSNYNFEVHVAFYNESTWVRTPLYLESSSPLYVTNTINLTNITRVRYIITIAKGTSINLSNVKIQLEKGSVVTEYEAYGVSPSPDYPSEIVNIYKAGTYNAIADNKIYTLTIDEDLRSVPNGVADRLWLNLLGSLDIERKVGRVVLNGSEGWDRGTTSTGYRYHTIVNDVKLNSTNYNVPNILCNYFRGITPNNSWQSTVGITTPININRIMICYETDNTSTTDLFKTWLSTHNTEVYYELATYTTSNIPKYSYNEFEYEEYKNNTTLIDLAGNEFTPSDKITIRDNQIILIKAKEETFLGNTVMPRTYTPYTYAYCHQKVYLNFKYKDPRNVDITKITLEGLLSITDIKTEYNFTSDDYIKVQKYITGKETLTNEEIELYDINGDGLITPLDYIKIKQMADGNISNKITGTLEINSTKSQRTIVLRNEAGVIQTSLGLNGITTPSLSVNNLSVNRAEVYGQQILYSGESNEDIELNDDVSNYEYIEIFYKDQTQCSSLKIHTPNGKYANLNIIDYDSGANGVWDKFKKIYIAGTSISNEWYGEITLHSSSINNTNTLYITRVVGYR